MAATETLKLLLEKSVKSGAFGKHLNKVQIITAGNGNLTASMKVEKEHCNEFGTLHGAFSALIVDNLSGFGLLTYPNITTAGVSVQISMTYMKAIKIGHEILIKSTTDKVGKSLAFLTVDILNRHNGELIARGSHTKFIGGR